jgi:hypothetical protein
MDFAINELYCSWIYDYLCSQCISPMAGRWISPGTPISSTNKTDWNIIENSVKHHNPHITQFHTMYNINVLIGRSWKDCIYLSGFIYNIGVLTINIEFMWRGLETGERRALVSISIRFVPSHINAIFTVNTPILYLSCNKICKKMLFNLIIKKR